MLNHTIKLTKNTLQIRSSSYRNLVVIVSLLLILSPIIALISFSWQPLVAWLLIPFFYTLFLYSDQQKLSHWQLTILSYWQDDELKLHFLEQSLMHLPIFPESTIKSMVALLPYPKKSDILPIEIRKILVILQKKINHCHRIRNVIIVLSSLIVLSSFLFSIVFVSFIPLFFILFIILFRIIEKWYFKQQWEAQLKNKIVFYKNDEIVSDILVRLEYYPLSKLHL